MHNYCVSVFGSYNYRQNCDDSILQNNTVGPAKAMKHTENYKKYWIPNGPRLYLWDDEVSSYLAAETQLSFKNRSWQFV